MASKGRRHEILTYSGWEAAVGGGGFLAGGDSGGGRRFGGDGGDLGLGGGGEGGLWDGGGAGGGEWENQDDGTAAAGRPPTA